MNKPSDVFAGLPDGSAFVRGLPPDDFDDMGAMRRKVLKLEQANGDLGETIGVLKQERARLWVALDNLSNAAQSRELDGENLPRLKQAYAVAREALEQVRIDR